MSMYLLLDLALVVASMVEGRWLWAMLFITYGLNNAVWLIMMIRDS